MKIHTHIYIYTRDKGKSDETKKEFDELNITQ